MERSTETYGIKSGKTVKYGSLFILSLEAAIFAIWKFLPLKVKYWKISSSLLSVTI
jgi:hypothetical protein